MPLYQREDSPFWWVTIGDDFRESTKIPHGGGVGPDQKKVRVPRDIKHPAVQYEVKAASRYYGEKRLGDRPAVSFRAAAVHWLNFNAKPKYSERKLLSWLGAGENPKDDLPAPAGPMLGERDVREVAEPEALDAIRALYRHSGKGGERAFGTVDRMMALISCVLNHAYKRMKALPGRVFVPLYRVEPEEPKYFTKEQFAAVNSRLPLHLALAQQFAVATLLREKAMLSLVWSHVTIYPAEPGELETGTAYILKRDSKGKRKTFHFPLNADAVAILRQLRALNPTGENVFQWNGRRIGKCNTSTYRNACRAAGCEWANWHTNRHTGATWARQGGAQDGELQSLGGWADPRQVRRYAHHGPIPKHIHAASRNIAGGDLARMALARSKELATFQTAGRGARSQNPHARVLAVDVEGLEIPLNRPGSVVQFDRIAGDIENRKNMHLGRSKGHTEDGNLAQRLTKPSRRTGT